MTSKQAEKANLASKKATAINQLESVAPLRIKAPVLTVKNERFVNAPLKVDETRLFVTNISNKITEEEILKLFGRYGIVLKAKLPKNDDATLKGYGFITYEKPEEALRAFT